MAFLDSVVRVMFDVAAPADERTHATKAAWKQVRTHPEIARIHGGAQGTKTGTGWFSGRHHLHDRWFASWNVACPHFLRGGKGHREHVLLENYSTQYYRTVYGACGEGRCDADLGGGVIKQRIGRPGKGKSGGFRTMVLYKTGTRAVFVHGFAKSDRANIREDERIALKALAAEMLAYDDKTIAKVVASGTLSEVRWDEREQNAKA